MFLMSTVKCGHSIRLLLVMHELYMNRESWMFHMSPMKHGQSVCHMYENYMDSYRKLPEEREGDRKMGNLPINL